MWSSDGQAVLLPGTFLKSRNSAPSRPCVAVVDLSSNSVSCVEELKRHTETGFEQGYHAISTARFVGASKQHVLVTFSNPEDHSYGTIEYRQNADGVWELATESEGIHELGYNDLDIAVKQGFNQPPLLIAMNKQRSRVLWDPNPQLKSIALERQTFTRGRTDTNEPGRDCYLNQITT